MAAPAGPCGGCLPLWHYSIVEWSHFIYSGCCCRICGPRGYDGKFFFFLPEGSTMMCDGCGFRWFDTLIMTTGFSVRLRNLGFLVGIKFSGGLMTSVGEVFKANKVGLVVFLLYRNWSQFRLRHRTKLTQKL